MKNRARFQVAFAVVGCTLLTTPRWAACQTTVDTQVSQRLSKAVAAGDPGEILRQFHDAVYDRDAKMGESLPAIRTYLNDPNPNVRYTAASYLYVAGDNSGYTTLVGLVQSPQPVPVRYNLPPEVIEASGGDTEDLRIAAASVLGKYRQTESAGAIRSLYDRTPSRRYELSRALITMGVKLPSPDTARFAPSELAITHYGIVGERRFLPQLIATFEQPPPPVLAVTPEIRVISAWALAELTGEGRYVDYLVKAAGDALTPNARGDLIYTKVTTALKYLGCLQHALVRPVLEDALDSHDFSAVEVALVNLLFNQPGGSEKARQLLLRQLRGERPRLQAAVLLDIASSFDDPEIEAAGKAFDRGAKGSWYLAAVEHRDWPVYNWIDNYVVRLNGVAAGLHPQRVLARPGP